MNGNHRGEAPKALQLVKRLADYGIDGAGPLSPAANLADEYRIDASYESTDQRVDALIRWEAAKNFTSGFITGLGGIITLPVAIPAALGASWIIQARMCAAIAALYGHDIKSNRVRTMVLLALLGDAGKEILKQAGVGIGTKISMAIINRIPGRVLIEVNKRIGFRLLTKAGERGVINLMKLVPGVGGVVSGTFDASVCIAVGRIAKYSFRTKPRRRARSGRPAKPSTNGRGAHRATLRGAAERRRKAASRP